jgi:spermidine synthase
MLALRSEMYSFLSVKRPRHQIVSIPRMPNVSNHAVSLFDSYQEDGDDSRIGSPHIEDEKGVLRLQFNGSDVQSEMDKKAPHELMLRYTRMMVSALSATKHIRQIAIIGLGGGSIPKYCYHHFPDSTIQVAEINPDVIAMRDRFFVPSDSDRFQVHCVDGADFVERQNGLFDVLFVDGFDQQGQPPQLSTLKFYRDCYRALAPQGMLVVNICAERHLVDRIRRSYFDEVAVMDSETQCLNTIVVATRK